jgi:transcriptional regulator with XRE-family HTH domain
LPDTTQDLLFDGDALRALRESKGWTMEELAGRVNVTRGAVHQWETGRNEPRFSVAARLAKVFGVSVSRFVAPGG